MTKKQKIILGAAAAALLLAVVLCFALRGGDDTDTAISENPSMEDGAEIKPDDEKTTDKPDSPEKDENGPQDDEEPGEDDPQEDENKPSEGADEPSGDDNKPQGSDKPSHGNSDNPQAPEKAVPDENGMVKIDNTWFEAPKALSESSISGFAKKMESLKANYLSAAATIKYSIIPDKSYYAQSRTDSYLDHDEMVKKVAAALPGWSYIEIGDLLGFDDYYRTDAHWRQEDIIPVAARIASNYGFTVSSADFTTQTRSGFVGDYRRYIGTDDTEDISWLESGATRGSASDHYQRPECKTVYDETYLKSNSPYDIFLGGPTPLVTVTNPDGPEGRRLVVFRDSFGSSLAPLLLSGYEQVTLVDLRYMVSSLLPEHVDFTDADVLIIYSANVVNNSAMLR